MLLTFFKLIFLVVLSGQLEDPSAELQFPAQRLDAWVDFLERAPAKVGRIHMSAPTANFKVSDYTSSDGSLCIDESKDPPVETIRNEHYAATVGVNKGGVPSLIRCGQDDMPKIISHGLNRTSGIAKLSMPDLIRQGQLKLTKISNSNGAVRYDFDPQGGGIPESIIGVSIEFDDQCPMPVFKEDRMEFENEVMMQRQFYSEFSIVNGEWVPSISKGGIVDSAGKEHFHSIAITYDPSVKFGPERFRLSYYGIPEPKMASFEKKSRNLFWPLMGLLVSIVIGFVFVRHFRSGR